MVVVGERARELLATARADENGRAAELVAHDGPLRQTLLALRAGTRLAEHNSPPAATIHLLQGQVRVTVAGETQADIAGGELWVLTHARHAVEALVDSVFLLTTVTSIDTPSHG